MTQYIETKLRLLHVSEDFKYIPEDYLPVRFLEKKIVHCKCSLYFVEWPVLTYEVVLTSIVPVQPHGAA
jgi:hypothetical protein